MYRHDDCISKSKDDYHEDYIDESKDDRMCKSHEDHMDKLKDGCMCKPYEYHMIKSKEYARAYILPQKYENLFSCKEGFLAGTIFKDLYRPYHDYDCKKNKC